MRLLRNPSTGSMVFFSFALGSLLPTLGCTTNNEATEVVGTEGGTEDDSGVDRPQGWSEETHGNDTEPNYELLFDVVGLPVKSIDHTTIVGTTSVQNFNRDLAFSPY